MLTIEQEVIWEMMEQQDVETVIRLFVNYHGTQLLSDEFIEFVLEELEELE